MCVLMLIYYCVDDMLLRVIVMIVTGRMNGYTVRMIWVRAEVYAVPHTTYLAPRMWVC